MKPGRSSVISRDRLADPFASKTSEAAAVYRGFALIARSYARCEVEFIDKISAASSAQNLMIEIEQGAI